MRVALKTRRKHEIRETKNGWALVTRGSEWSVKGRARWKEPGVDPCLNRE